MKQNNQWSHNLEVNTRHNLTGRKSICKSDTPPKQSLHWHGTWHLYNGCSSKRQTCLCLVNCKPCSHSYSFIKGIKGNTKCCVDDSPPTWGGRRRRLCFGESLRHESSPLCLHSPPRACCLFPEFFMWNICMVSIHGIVNTFSYLTETVKRKAKLTHAIMSPLKMILINSFLK